MLMTRLTKRSLVTLVAATVFFVTSFSTAASAAWDLVPSCFKIPEVFSYSDTETSPFDNVYAYLPDSYTTHRLSGYGTFVLALIAMGTHDDSGLHKGSGIGAAAMGVLAGASGHSAYGDAIDLSQGWTPENIHAVSGYIATAGLVLAAALGASDADHGAVGGIATASATIPVVFVSF